MMKIGGEITVRSPGWFGADSLVVTSGRAVDKRCESAFGTAETTDMFTG